MANWMKLTTPEGNMKGLQRIMNKILNSNTALQIERAGQYASLASAMNAALRVQMDREKFDWDKKEVAELRAEIEALKRQRD